MTAVFDEVQETPSSRAKFPMSADSPSSINDPNQLSTEDCAYLLRTLEIDAFSTLVSAFRAQGPLTNYKDEVLQHVKAALFISDDRLKGELRRAANDQNLLQIAKKLNPNYDVFTSWAKGGVPGAAGTIGTKFEMDMDEISVPNFSMLSPKRSGNSCGGETMKLANELLLLADKHNSALENANQEFVNLVQLPKKPYVPETLRNLLKMSEDDSEGMCLIKSPRKKQKLKEMQEKRQTEAKNSMPNANNAQQQVSGPGSGFGGNSNSKLLEIGKRSRSSVSQSVDSVAEQDTLNVARIRESIEQSTASAMANLPATRIKFRQPRENATMTCARVHPFVFPPLDPNTKAKPPRGNPDRRTTKRPANGAIYYQSSSGTPQQSVNLAVVGPSSPPTNFPVKTSSSYASQIAPLIKRQRTASSVHPVAAEVIPAAAAPEPAIYQRQMIQGGSAAGSHHDPLITRPRQQHLPPRALIRPISSLPVNTGGAGGGPRYLISSTSYSNPTRPYYGSPMSVGGTTAKNPQDSATSSGLGNAVSTASSGFGPGPILVPSHQRRPPVQYIKRTPYTTTVYATSPNLATSRAPVSATIVHSEETWTPAHENTQQSASAAAVSSTQPSLECVSERVSGAEDGSPTDIKNKSE